jgi:hypothetical protein
MAILPGLGIKATLVALQAYLRAILALKALVKEPSNISSPFCSGMGYNPSVPGAL